MPERRPIVVELQDLANDPNVDVATLLRKALIVATKLGLDDFREWIQSELQGYVGEVGAPAYRRLEAEIRLHNPYYGLIPFMFGNQRTADVFCKVAVGSSVGDLSALLARESDGDLLTLPLSHEQTKVLMKTQDGPHLPPVRVVPRNHIAAILDVVRTTVLEWALKLEQEGIVGEGISFSAEEKAKAAHTASIHIDQFQGVLGNVSNSAIVQDLRMDVQQGDLASLCEFLASKGVDNEDLAELRDAIGADPAPKEPGSFGPRVAAWFGKMMGKAASGAWQIGASTATALLTQALMRHYGLA